MRKFAPLTFDLIEEGRFARSVDEELGEIRRALVAYVKKHGEAAEKAKAELSIKITLQFDGGPDAEDYSIKCTLSTKRPGRPALVTRAFEEVEQDGTPTLFVRASGSDANPPRQMKLATDDGRVVDQKTGKPKGEIQD